MITHVSFTNSLNETLTIPMRDFDASGLIIVDVSGIGGPKGTANTVTSPGEPGARIQNRVVERRVITFQFAIQKIGVEEELLREQLYEFFPTMEDVTITFVTLTKTVYIVGVVESNDINMFSKIENASVSVMCAQPYFLEENTVKVSSAGVIPQFYFPWSNESLTEPLLYMGDIQTNAALDIVYRGGRGTGVIIKINIFGPIGDITVSNNSHNQSMTLDVSQITHIIGTPLDTGDVLTIDTRFGENTVECLHDGVTYNVLNALAIGTDWISIERGDNSLVFTATSGFENMSTDITYHVYRQGV